MGKLAGVKKALDMSKKARMQRAKDMGFDTEHAFNGRIVDQTSAEKLLAYRKDFDDAYNAGADARRNAESMGGGYEEYLPGWIYDGDPSTMDNARLRQIAARMGADGKAPEYVVADRYNDVVPSGFSTNYMDDTAEQGTSVLGLVDDNQGLQLSNNGAYELFTEETDKNRIIGILNPYTTGSDGEPLLLMPVQQKGVRSVDAAFDPAKKDSANLLAGTAATAVGTGAMLGADDADASAQILEHQQAQEVKRRGQQFLQRRRAKQDHFRGLREGIYKALELAEMPQQGLMALTRLGYDAATGNENALQNAARVATQPVDDTAQEFGDYVYDQTGSPAAATAGYVGANVISPL